MIIRSLTGYLTPILRGGITGLLLAVILHAGYILLGTNFHTVLPGQVYRCAQPSPAELARVVRRYGIRTVVNLRGCCPAGVWYQQEAQASSDLDVLQEDIHLSALRLPSRHAVRQLVEVLMRAEGPLLLHCQQGADRTGLAAVMVVLLRTSATLEEGLTHVGPATGHVPLGRTIHVDRFFVLYQKWLEGQGKTHSSEVFADWARNHYIPGVGKADFELLAPVPESGQLRPVVRLPAGKQQRFRVRATNTSLGEWRFYPGASAGIHAWVTLQTREQRVLRSERVGLYQARIAPGQAIDLEVPVIALPPGQYELRIDFADEQHAYFAQLGNDPLVVALEVS